MTTIRVGWILFLAVIITIILAPLHFVGCIFSHAFCRKIETWWHRAACYLLRIRVQTYGALAHPDGHGVLIAANHVSWTDIIILGSLAPVSFVAKDEVRNWPVFGTLAKWQNCIFIDRDIRTGARKQAEAINNRLASGDNMVLFPEGTTSDGNFIYPFKSSLFGAIGVGGTTLESPIQPVSIAYISQYGLPMGRYDRPLAAWPGNIGLIPHLLKILQHGHIGVIVSFGEPVTNTCNMNRKQITALIEQRVAEMTSLTLRGKTPLLNTIKTD